MNPREQTILITGAAGRIGRTLCQAFQGRYGLVRLFDRVPLTASHPTEEVVTAELSDIAALDAAMRGVDCLIHLAAIPGEASFEDLVEPNIMGAYRVFESARRAGVRRVIYASSVQAVGFHRLAGGVDQATRIRPSGFYGVTKAFGEALASLYADKFGISVACLRIASFERAPQDQRQLATWLSPEDCVRLVQACIEAPPFSFKMVYGLSANTRTIVRDAPPDPIRYFAKDDAEAFGATVDFDPDLATATTLFVGGAYCGLDFVGDFGGID